MMNKKLLKKLQISLVSLSAISLLAACGNDTNTDSTTPPVEEQEETTTEESSTDGEQEVVETPNTGDYANLTVKPEEAFDVYRDKYPNAKITQVQLDQDMGNFVYKVDGFEGTTEYELKIDPMDATILKEDTDTDKDDDLDEMEITREQVEKVMDLVDKALSEAEDGATLKEWTIDADDGLVKLEVELDVDGFDDQERTYNIETGELLEIDN